MRSHCDCGSGSETTSSECILTAVDGAPIMCTIAKSDMQQRADDLRIAFEQLVSSERNADGFRWTFRNQPGFARSLCELATREHQCCPFVTFRLRSSPDSVVWEVSGRAEAQGVIDVFYRTPQTLAGDLHQVKLEAERAGLTFTASGSTENA